MAWELFENKNNDWLKDGWSLDLVTTQKRGGLGIAKDLYENKLIEIDIGGYVTNEYDNFKTGQLDPRIGAGINISF